MAKKFLIILGIILILFCLALSFFYWFKFVKPKSEVFTLCNKFSLTKDEIPCRKAVELALAKYSGRIYEITQEQIFSYIGEEGKGKESVQEVKEDVWLIGINLENPMEISQTEPKRMSNAIKVSVSRTTGEVRIYEIKWKKL